MFNLITYFVKLAQLFIFINLCKRLFWLFMVQFNFIFVIQWISCVFYLSYGVVKSLRQATLYLKHTNLYTKLVKKLKHISDFETNTQHKLPIQVLFSWKCLLNFWSSRLCIRGRAWRWKRSRDLLPAGCCIHADPHSPHPSSATISPAPSIFLPRPLLRSHLLFYWFFCLF